MGIISHHKLQNVANVWKRKLPNPIMNASAIEISITCPFSHYFYNAKCIVSTQISPQI